MRKILVLAACLMLTGCASLTVNRLQKDKDQNKNTTIVKVPCDIENAKKIVKECIREVNLVERSEIEKPDFMFADTGYGDFSKQYYSTLGTHPTALYKVGFFLNCDDKTKITTITIVEESGYYSSWGLLGGLAGTPQIRGTLADKIKLKTIEKNKEDEKK